MKLLERLHSYRLLDPNAAGYVAITANDNGAVVAFGASHADAIGELVKKITDYRTPQSTFGEAFGPRSQAEWAHEQGDWY